MHSFNELREEYRAFNFTHYEKSFEDGFLKVVYHYDIIGLESFVTKWNFKVGDSYKNRIDGDDISSAISDDKNLDRFVFSLGMAEAISYYKCACPKKLLVECGVLDEWQIKWWRKLFYHGLGEFLYVNNIEVVKKIWWRSEPEVVQILRTRSRDHVRHRVRDKQFSRMDRNITESWYPWVAARIRWSLWKF